MNMKTKILIALGMTAILAIAIVTIGSAVSGAAFTTFNPWVDGLFKEVCKNSIINCNIYGAKPDVWLNGGPAANGLGPDGEYFFAVLVPGGQPNPNDGAVGVLNDGDKNLSDDYDKYDNRTFTVKDGEVSFYGGTHDLDSGNFINPTRKYCNKPRGCAPDGEEPLIRLAPYADTTNPGGVYILAICSLKEGYPVDPRDCKYDAFKVKEGPATASFLLWGIKFEDLYANGVKDATDPGLSGWDIHITGTGFLGEPIDETVTTGANGFWSFQKDYTYTKSTLLVSADLTICEVLKTGWTQSYPDPVCYHQVIAPSSLAEVGDLDFGNWQPVDVKACKVRDLDGKTDGETVAVPGWIVSLTKENVVVDSQPTGADGCYTWTGLTPGYSYDVHEEMKAGWEALGLTDVVFPKAKSNDSFSYTFVNAVLQGCTPGFWQGGSAGGQAGGQWLWDEVNDPQWVASGGIPYNPYIHTTAFCTEFSCGNSGDMWYYINPNMWDVNNDFHKAARSMTAAYLNASWGMNYPYTTDELKQMWLDYSGDYLTLHNLLDAANNSMADTNGDGILEHQCPISASGY
jgi:hypothetical protein